MSKKLSVCIPMYNEEKIVADTASELTAFLDSKLGDDYEIIFSNDGSRDKCADIVGKISNQKIRLVGYPDNRGTGSAVREAVLKAEGDIVLYTDCDLAYGCDAIISMYDNIIGSDADIVIGSRNISDDGYEGYTPLRKFMSRTYIKVISIFAGFKYSDSQCGIKCFRKDSAKKIFSECQINGFAFDLEVLILANIFGLKVNEAPVKIINHRESESKVNPIKDTLRMLRDVAKIKRIHKNKRKKQ